MAFIARDPPDSLYSNTILELRHSQNLTQEQFASRCGVSRVIISRAENGHPIGVKAASQIANTLGRRIEDLFLEEPKTSVHRILSRTQSSRAPDLAGSRQQIRNISLVLNPHTGLPAIGYLYYNLDDWNSDSLRYAQKKPDGSWEIEIITKRANRPSADATITLSPTGRLQALFKPGVESMELYYGHREDNGGWCFEQVALGRTVQPYASSLRLDQQDCPHIVYIQPTTKPSPHILEPPLLPVQAGTLCYAQYDGSIWHSERIDPDSNNLSYVQPYYGFQLDHQGWPYIAYVNFGRSGTTDQLRLAHRAGDGWQIETISEHQQLTGSIGEKQVFLTSIHTVCLLLDSQDRPHLLYLVDLPPRTLLHTYRSNTGWDTEKIPIPWQPGGPLECTFDPHDNLHIVTWSFQHDGENALHHAPEKPCNQIGGIWYIRQISGWVIEEIVMEPYGTELSLALDNLGRPHLTYYAASDGGLWYTARKGPHRWLCTQVNGESNSDHQAIGPANEHKDDLE